MAEKLLDTTLQVLWEAFTFEFAGAGFVSPVFDLTFSSNIPPEVSEIADMRRAGSGSPALFLQGCESTCVSIIQKEKNDCQETTTGSLVSVGAVRPSMLNKVKVLEGCLHHCH